ncbi:tetratricopeptide repeat protein [bacterium]|nr:tetratricopeptide repeat protein [bacterium]
MAEASAGSGRHEIIDIADILQSLGNKRWTGTLQVISHARNVHLFLRDGIIQHSKADASKVVLGRALFKLGRLDESDLNLVLNTAELQGKRVGKACVSLGLVTDDDIHEALSFQARESVLDLFTWDDVDARFHPGEPPLVTVFGPEEIETKLNLSPMALLMEAARRADEWEVVKAELPTGDEVLVSANGNGTKSSGAERRLLALVDGYRTANEIAGLSATANFEALRQLAELVKGGRLKRLDPVELAKVALEAEREADLPKALKLYELAQSRGLGDRIDLAKRIARVYQLLGNTKESVAHWIRLAARCEELGQLDKAIEAYRAGLAIEPERLEAQERLAKHLVSLHRTDEAATQLHVLIEHLEDAGEVDKKKLLWAYDQLLELAPDDEPALKRSAELYLLEGDKVHAVVRLDELAQHMVSREAFDEAVASYHRVLEIDEECLEARLSLAQCLGKTGNTDDAVREYRRLAELLQKSGLIQNSTNWTFLFKVYESIVELEPAATAAWEWLAKAYLENGDTARAITRYLGMAQSLTPKDEGTPPPPEIIAPLKKVAELAPANVEVRRRLASAYLALDRTAEAVRTLHELARMHADAKTPALAIAALNESLRADPFHIDSRRLLAELREGQGERELAFEGWSDLGGLCLRAGLAGEAAESFQRALAIKPDDAPALHEWAKAEERRGGRGEAAAIYGKLARLEEGRENMGAARAALAKQRELGAAAPRAPGGRLGLPAPLPPMPPPPTGSARLSPDRKGSSRFAIPALPAPPLPPMTDGKTSGRFTLPKAAPASPSPDEKTPLRVAPRPPSPPSASPPPSPSPDEKSSGRFSPPKAPPLPPSPPKKDMGVETPPDPTPIRK